MSTAWEGVGLFALAESQIDRLLESYTSAIPDPLRPVLLKTLRSDDRRNGLRILLEEWNLTIHYPALCTLFDTVRKSRNRLAHGNLIYVEGEDFSTTDGGIEADGSPVIVDPTDLIVEGLGIQGNSGMGRMPATEVQEFRDSAVRLVGLLTTLIYETGTAGEDAPRPTHERDFVVLLLGDRRVKLDSPRQPMTTYRRRTFTQE